MDRARQKTDKQLKDLEKRVKAIYASDPQLKVVQKEYDDYMESVEKKTNKLYSEYQKAQAREDKERLKKQYANEVKKLTLDSVEYRRIVKKFSKVMAVVNQKALDLANAEMQSIYVTNYNQVAVTCKNVGIKVDGETE